jgi:hypothetical protein
MARRAGVHKAQKRAKELTRQKKQEEKRQRRLNKKIDAQPGIEEPHAEGKDEEHGT